MKEEREREREREREKGRGGESPQELAPTPGEFSRALLHLALDRPQPGARTAGSRGIALSRRADRPQLSATRNCRLFVGKRSCVAKERE